VVQDNEVVGDIVAKDGKTKRLQALRPFLRIFRLVWQAIKDMHVAIKTVASGANAANSLTKMSPGPLATVRGLEGVMGWSPELQEYVDAADGGTARSAAVTSTGRTRRTKWSGQLSLRGRTGRSNIGSGGRRRQHGASWGGTDFRPRRIGCGTIRMRDCQSR
jgi:hypothetical protein